MKAIQIFAATGILATAALASAPVSLPYQTGFEMGEGYALGTLENQGAWQVSGPGIEVVTGSSGAGSQSVSIASAVPGHTLTLPIDSAATTGVVYIDFLGKFAVHAPGQLPALANVSLFPPSAWEKIAELTGELSVMDGDGNGGGVWVSTGVTAPISGNVTQNWHRYTYRIDYSSGTWDLYLDGTPVAYDVALVDPAASLTHFTLRGSETETVGFDALRITTVNPLFTDADSDGMDDAWETAHGLNPAVNDRNGDADNDGYSNIEEYAAGTSANNPDSDGDGMKDGWEATHGLNPLEAADGTMTRVNFNNLIISYNRSGQDFESVEMESLNGGDTLHLWGNNWKALNASVTIKPDTTLRVTYLSIGEQPEIAAVGFENYLWEDQKYHFALWGTQNWGLRNYYGYAARGEKTYVTRPGAYMANGFYHYLVFTNDADAGQAANVYFRDVAYGADADGDGWFNKEEWENGTDPNDPASPGLYVAPVVDKDGDGLSDAWELQYFNNLTTASQTTDSDGDGLLDSAEQTAGWDPTSTDSDGDGMLDVWEVAHGFNPLDAADGKINRINFKETPPVKYSTQDPNSTEFETLDEGRTLRMWKNNWKAVIANAVMRADTTLRVVFSSTGAQAEINAVGLENSTVENQNNHFALWGTQVWGRRNYYGYTGNGHQQTYLLRNVRPAGTYKYLVFANDADAGQATNVTYRDVAYGADADGDGWFNAEEFRNGTDPHVADPYPTADTDGDGLNDAWENLYGLNPNDPADAALDLDGDGLSNEWEIQHRLNPASANDANQDPDGDGYTNLQESQQGTDPWTWNDLIAPTQPGPLILKAATATSLWLSWGASTDNHKIARYDIYRDNVLVTYRLGNEAQQSVTLAGLEPDTAYQFKVIAVDDAGNASLPVELAASMQASQSLPDGWTAADIGSVKQPGASRYDAGTNIWTASGSGSSYFDGEDGFHFLYKTLPVNGRITMRLLDTQLANKGVKVGLAVRATLEPGSVHGTAYVSPNSGINALVRYKAGDVASREAAGLQWKPAWLRLARKNSAVEVYASADGTHWQRINTYELGLAGDVYAGVFVNSLESESAYADGRSVTALFDHLELDMDSDQDGLYDSEEAVLGTNLNSSDSDGDGFSDWVERYETFTDPLVADLQDGGVAVEILGSQFVSSVGQWTIQDGGVINQLQAGSVTYPVNVLVSDVYLLDVTLSLPGAAEGARYAFDVLVDGHFVRTQQGFRNGTGPNVESLFLPWLPAGPHTVTLRLANYFGFRKILFQKLELRKVEGADANQNGIKDWLEHRLQILNSVEGADAASFVSPACLQGDVFQPGLVKINNGTVPVHPAPNDRWYANVPLQANAPVSVTASFENGALTQQRTYAWKLLNLIDDTVRTEFAAATTYQMYTRPTLRVGDSLHLAAYLNQPEGNHPAQIQVERFVDAALTQSAGVPVVQDMTAADTWIHAFTQPGYYRLTATYQHGNGNGNGNNGSGDGNTVTTRQMELEVLGAELGESLPIWISRPRAFSEAGLSAGVQVEADLRVDLNRWAGEAGAPGTLVVNTNDLGHFYLAARLGSNGPILDTKEIVGFHIASTSGTFVELVAKLPDGTQVLDTGLYITEKIPDIEVLLQMFVGGVFFSDGTVEKRLTMSDFDEHGLATVRFLKAAEVDTSICHQMRVFDGPELLGVR
jgi:hypothetical protein